MDHGDGLRGSRFPKRPQRVDHHFRREEIRKRKGLVSTGGQGGNRRSREKSSHGSYAEQASETLGASKRSFAKDTGRGKTVTPDVMAETPR